MPRTNAVLNQSNTCRCSVCGEYFSTLSNFDRHRKGEHGKKVCVDPESVGLVIGSRGAGSVWKMPGIESEIDYGKAESVEDASGQAPAKVDA